MGFFGNSRELQFGTRKLQQNHRHEQRRGGSFTEERGSLGGAVLSKKPTGVNCESYVSWLLIG